MNDILAMTPVITGLYTFLLGLLITFFGIGIIILCVTLAGKILNKAEKEKKTTIEVKKETTENTTVTEVSGEIPENVKVAIVAAISAYYFNQKSECDFKVKKIKRI